MRKKVKDYRLKVERGNNTYWVSRRNCRIEVVNAADMPLSVSYLSFGAVPTPEVRFQLEDARDGSAAAAALRTILAGREGLKVTVIG